MSQRFWPSTSISGDGQRMTAVHIHGDQASLEFHVEVAGPKFPPIGEFIELESIDLYGRPSEAIVRQLRDEVSELGSRRVSVHELHRDVDRVTDDRGRVEFPDDRRIGVVHLGATSFDITRDAAETHRSIFRNSDTSNQPLATHCPEAAHSTRRVLPRSKGVVELRAAIDGADWLC